MRSKFAKAAVVVTSLAAFTGTTAATAQAADEYGLPSCQACWGQGKTLTDNGRTAGFMCTEQQDGRLLD